MPSWLGGPEFIVIVIVGFVIFGAKRMPDAARSLGRSLRIFKAETKGLKDDFHDGYGEDGTAKAAAVTAGEQVAAEHPTAPSATAPAAPALPAVAAAPSPAADPADSDSR